MRHFINVASFGFSSAVATRANASSKASAPKIAFIAATVRELIAYDNTDVWLAIDGGPAAGAADDGRGRQRALLRRRMKICPEARLDDGALIW